MIRALCIALTLLVLVGCRATFERAPDGTWTITAEGTGDNALVGVPVASTEVASQTRGTVTPLSLAISRAEKENTPAAWAEVHRLGKQLAIYASKRGHQAATAIGNVFNNSATEFGKLD